MRLLTLKYPIILLINLKIQHIINLKLGNFKYLFKKFLTIKCQKNIYQVYNSICLY